MKFIEPLRFQSLANKALLNGALHKTPTTLEWDISENCENPVVRTVYTGNCEPDDGALTPEANQRLGASREKRRFIDMTVKCRKCQTCLKNRARLWRRRAQVELKRAPRTWMGTMTVNPHHRVRFKILAGKKLNCNIDELSEEKCFAAVANEVGKAFTKYLKRIRKAHGANCLRFMLVTERHKDGFPHLHVLIHEVGAPIKKRSLEKQWPYGFTRFKLCEDHQRASWYVTKYLVKSMMARVRASLRYGPTV